MKKLKAKYIKRTSSDRLYGYDRPIIAITGGIATGKSTVSKILAQKGFELIDADQLVKTIYQTEEAKKFIQTQYPDAWVNGAIDFTQLRELFFENPAVKVAVEKFIYARLPEAFKEKASSIKNQDFFIYDVPLLFERQLDKFVDLSVVVYAPSHIQKARLMDRDGHVEEMAQNIMNHQMNIEDKKLQADFVINNAGSLVELAAEVESFLQQVLE